MRATYIVIEDTGTRAEIAAYDHEDAAAHFASLYCADVDEVNLHVTDAGGREKTLRVVRENEWSFRAEEEI